MPSITVNQVVHNCYTLCRNFAILLCLGTYFQQVFAKATNRTNKADRPGSSAAYLNKMSMDSWAFLKLSLKFSGTKGPGPVEDDILIAKLRPGKRS